MRNASLTVIVLFVTLILVPSKRRIRMKVAVWFLAIVSGIVVVPIVFIFSVVCTWNIVIPLFLALFGANEEIDYFDSFVEIFITALLWPMTNTVRTLQFIRREMEDALRSL